MDIFKAISLIALFILLIALLLIAPRCPAKRQKAPRKTLREELTEAFYSRDRE